MKNESLLYQVYDTAADNILIIDRQSRKIVDANKTALRMLGYTKEELLTKIASDISDIFTSEVLQTACQDSIDIKEKFDVFFRSIQTKR